VTQLADLWANRFGLACAPLFEAQETSQPAAHRVLLDGGLGTFALSESEEELWRFENVAAWAWSGDIPHHVTVTPHQVAVARWDNPDVEVFSRKSIEKQAEEFYKFLCADKVQSSLSVVSHLLLLFRKIRSLVALTKIPDARTTDVFLCALSKLLQSEAGIQPSPSEGLAKDAEELFGELSSLGLQQALNEIRRISTLRSNLELLTSLAVRHASGQLFQEAHFELLRAPSIDLLGDIGVPDTGSVSRGGAHFTPPALARIVTELAFARVVGLQTRSELTICDPACGSGAFLHEALRALRRSGFNGRAIVIGVDVSEPALAMARFTLAASKRDWQPQGGIELRFAAADSLDEGSIPPADLIVMNPPFIAWGGQTKRQREQLVEILGSKAPRGDLSMAFVAKAVETLKPGGVVGSLFPASLLSLQGAREWRGQLLEKADLSFVGSLGDFGLFSHALVQVACAVMTKKGSTETPVQTFGLVTANDPSATGDALRWVRKSIGEPPSMPIVDEQWSLYPLDQATLQDRESWRLIPPRAEDALRRLADAGLPKIRDIFEVKRGVQTGFNTALLLTAEEWRALPAAERATFRAATMTNSISGGQIVKPYYVFFPYDAAGGPLFKDEKDLKARVPQYFQRHLAPHREQLARRIDITRPGRSDWWGLAYPRAFSSERRPRLISKYFSGAGGFVLDADAEFLPVMGFAWLIKEDVLQASRDSGTAVLALDASVDVDGDSSDAEVEALAAYLAIFNSQTFMKLAELYCPTVAGGQFDLSPRYVDQIPIPHIFELMGDEARARVVHELAVLGRAEDIGRLSWLRRTDSAVAALYGQEIVSAL
jgi:adenine-specific DNA-methyltransferase